jgi:hypothetical protein
MRLENRNKKGTAGKTSSAKQPNKPSLPKQT